MIQLQAMLLSNCKGAILEGQLDKTHPLGFGYDSDLIPLFRRNAKFMTRSRDPYSTPILYSKEPFCLGICPRRTGGLYQIRPLS